MERWLHILLELLLGLAALSASAVEGLQGRLVTPHWLAQHLGLSPRQDVLMMPELRPEN